MASERGAEGGARQAATVAGLSSFDVPTLESVERRRLQLWSVALGLLIVLATAFAAVVALHGAILPDWLPLRVTQVALLVLIALFAFYALEKEKQLRRLTRLLTEERILTASLTERLSEVNALLEAGRAINLDLELRDVLARIANAALELLGGRDASVMLVHGETELRTVAATGHSAAHGARLRFGEGIAGRAAASREPLLVRGAVARPAPAAEIADLIPSPPESAMSVPLVHRGDLLGVLNVNARPPRLFTEHDLRALSVFGAQASAAVANARLLEEQRLAASRTLFQALHDGLTGLPNRACFLDRLGQVLRRRTAEDVSLAVILIDLDDFKRVNDSLGHEAGDRVLVAFADGARRRVREGDTVARFGGDEFAALVEAIPSAEQAIEAARRLLGALDEPVTVGAHRLRLRASAGVVVGNAGTLPASEFVRRADVALTVAKRRGKGAIVLYEPDLQVDAIDRVALETELVDARERGEFEVHYQPIVQVADGRVVGVEALLRWRHRQRGLLPAGVFVPTAEAMGMLAQLDLWLAREACREALSWPGGEHAPAVFLNLAPERLRLPSLPVLLREILAETGLPPHRLTLEIVESARLEEIPEAAPRLAELKAVGVRLALDDFGSGYATLGLLQRFAVDMVKIDRIFVEGLTEEGGERTLVRAILRLAGALGLEVVAEGVEREEQKKALLALGCDLAQGYLLGAPMPATELAARLG